MSKTQFLPATFAGGLKMPHYVNGRLLYADDLKADQDATLSRTRSLGQATGYGVVEGLMVSQAGAASVQVAPGLGINREGQLIRLSSAVTLALAPTAPSAQPLDQAGLFRECTFKPAGNGSGAVADGPYLLAATPASQEDGQAPVKGGSTNGSPGSSPSCAAKWEVEGVQFKVISLSQFSETTSTTNRQNLLAHWCLGTGVISGLPGLRALPPDPFSFDEDFTGLDLLSPADLTTCDLPLAVFYWSGGKVAFVDAWAARRRPVRPYALEAWRGSLSDKRVALAQARFLQFQAQAEKLASSPVAGSLAGKDYFPFLPPVGFLPVRPADFLVKALLQELEPAATPVQATPSKASEFVVFRTAMSRDTTASSAAMVAARQAVLGNRSDAAIERLAVLTRGVLPQAGFRPADVLRLSPAKPRRPDLGRIGGLLPATVLV